MDPTVHFQSDFIPLGHQKAVHGNGVVCQVRLVIEPCEEGRGRYTGLLAEGGEYAVLRMSSVLNPAPVAAGGVGGVVPSIALKVFRDGRESANWLALNSEAPQTDSSNPFALPLTNQFVALPPAIITKFSSVTAYPNFSQHTSPFLTSTAARHAALAPSSPHSLTLSLVAFSRLQRVTVSWLMWSIRTRSSCACL